MAPGPPNPKTVSGWEERPSNKRDSQSGVTKNGARTVVVGVVVVAVVVVVVVGNE